MITDLYPWIKALHIIAVIAWMAGMLYLPRLFVYHTQVAVGSEASELFKVMERRLLRFIINPAMIVAWLAGGWLIHKTNALDAQNGMWMHRRCECCKSAIFMSNGLAHANVSSIS